MKGLSFKPLAEGELPQTPRDAATILFLRDQEGNDGTTVLEVFSVERSQGSGFLAGAVVFPGGKVDPHDHHPDWLEHLSLSESASIAAGWIELAENSSMQRALGIAACREALEEAGVLLSASGAPIDTTGASQTAFGIHILESLRARGDKLDLSLLRPFGRWLTPKEEARRFDTRFFLATVPEGQVLTADEHETTKPSWSTPSALLRRFEKGEIQLAPPTHRCLEILEGFTSTRDALCAEYNCSLICPEVVVDGDTFALTLPGDREHTKKIPVVPGRSRYVLRGEQFLPEDAPYWRKTLPPLK